MPFREKVKYELKCVSSSKYWIAAFIFTKKSQVLTFSSSGTIVQPLINQISSITFRV